MSELNSIKTENQKLLELTTETENLKEENEKTKKK